MISYLLFLLFRVVVAALSPPSSPTILAPLLPHTWAPCLTTSPASRLQPSVPPYTPSLDNMAHTAPWAWSSWLPGTKHPCINNELMLPTPSLSPPARSATPPGSPPPSPRTIQASPSTRSPPTTYLMSSPSMTGLLVSCTRTTRTITPLRRRSHTSRSLSTPSCST